MVADLHKLFTLSLYAEILLNIHALKSWGVNGVWLRDVRLRFQTPFSVRSFHRAVRHPIYTSPQGRPMQTFLLPPRRIDCSKLLGTENSLGSRRSEYSPGSNVPGFVVLETRKSLGSRRSDCSLTGLVVLESRNSLGSRRSVCLLGLNASGLAVLETRNSLGSRRLDCSPG